MDPQRIDPQRTTTAMVGSLEDLAVGTMKMARVGDHRVVVARTESGTHALDNACPHQGYGLATGALAGDHITCQWHNWKFCVVDGTCTVGEEDVRAHPVEIRGDEVWVSVTEPTDEERLVALWPSLRRGIEADYRGQIARDVARLLDAGADPVDIVWEGLRIGAPKAEDGIGHEMASAADCLAAVELFDDLERTLPVTQALVGISETTRDRLPYSPDPEVSARTDTVDFVAAVEAEEVDGAIAALQVALAAGADLASVRQQFVQVVSMHHLSYGHGAIYTQKAFEVLERVGWSRADDVLPHLARTIVYGTREDTLPYMRKAMRAIEGVDLAALAVAPDRHDTGWAGEPALRRVLLDVGEAPIEAAAAAVIEGAGVGGLLDAVVLAVAERLIRYDESTDHDFTTDFGWLDISHGLTYARAARWAWDHHPSPATARLALFTVFLAYDTGRHERRAGVTPPRPPGEATGTLTAAIVAGRADDAMAIAAAGDPEAVGDELRRTALLDGAGSFLVAAHLVKMARAASEEAATTGSNLPLVATARLAAAPRLERFVARDVAEAVEFVRTGTPPTR
ncbi:MAG: Rieske (2Fe-2S) protein [Acidimicrobiales bacterium]